MNVQILTDPFGRLLWASPALPGSTHDLTAARQHEIIEALTKASSDVGQTRLTKASADPLRTVSRVAPKAVEALPQHHPCQDPLPRRAGHGRSEGSASPAEAPLQHQPHPSDRPGRPRPSPRVSVRLEKPISCGKWRAPRGAGGPDHPKLRAIQEPQALLHPVAQPFSRWAATIAYPA